MKALLIVDVQGDFMDGSLSVPGWEKAFDNIEDVIRNGGHDLLIASRDWHPADHCSFTEQGGPWPAHCVQGTPGAELRFTASDTDTRPIYFVDKGTRQDVDAYSAFAGRVERASNANLAARVLLTQLLVARQVLALDVVGYATDVCVKATALDAKNELPGIDVRVLDDACAAVTADGEAQAHRVFGAAGIEVA